MNEAHRSLFVRGNRALGLALVEAGLVSQNVLEAASSRMIETGSNGAERRPGLLEILVFDQQVLKEADLLAYLSTRHQVGLIDLKHYAVQIPQDLDLAACRITGTLPFDERDGVHCVATTCYLSQPIRTWWERLLGRNIVWYATPLSSLLDCLEHLTQIQPGGE